MLARPQRWLTKAQRQWVMCAFDDYVQGWTTGDGRREREAFVALLRRRTRAKWRVPPKLSALDRQIRQLERRKDAIEDDKKRVEIRLHQVEGQIASSKGLRSMQARKDQEEPR